jgi:dethiobiotin synthetase
MKGFFVTGTDTGIGKTHIASCLLRELKTLGFNPAPFKPVASGVDENGLNSDLQSLVQASGFTGDVEEICPYLFNPHIAPHIAAELTAESITLSTIVTTLSRLAANHDAVIVEGAGGWRVPISEHYDMRSLAIALNLPVIVVVGIRLGCINHGLLTLESVVQSKVPVVGWIANHLEDTSSVAERNVDALRARSPVKLLGESLYGSSKIGWMPEFSLAELINR